jgi:hypothetical protein
MNTLTLKTSLRSTITDVFPGLNPALVDRLCDRIAEGFKPVPKTWKTAQAMLDGQAAGHKEEVAKLREENLALTRKSEVAINDYKNVLRKVAKEIEGAREAILERGSFDPMISLGDNIRRIGVRTFSGGPLNTPSTAWARHAIGQGANEYVSPSTDPVLKQEQSTASYLLRQVRQTLSAAGIEERTYGRTRLTSEMLTDAIQAVKERKAIGQKLSANCPVALPTSVPQHTEELIKRYNEANETIRQLRAGNKEPSLAKTVKDAITRGGEFFSPDRETAAELVVRFMGDVVKQEDALGRERQQNLDLVSANNSLRNDVQILTRRSRGLSSGPTIAIGANNAQLIKDQMERIRCLEQFNAGLAEKLETVRKSVGL